MENLNYEQPELTIEAEKKKKERRFAFFLYICFGLILLLLSITGWIVYDKFENKKSMSDLQRQFVNVDSQRIVLKEAYDLALQKMDSLSYENLNLQQELQVRKAQIEKLTADIDGIVKEKDADLRKARIKIRELSRQITALLLEIEKLRTDNKNLWTINKQLVRSNDSLLINIRPVEIKDSVKYSFAVKKEEKVVIPNLKVSEMMVAPSNDKGETNVSRQVSSIKLSFVLDENKSIPAGTKDLYLVLTGPDGNVIKSDKYSSGENGSFETADGIKKTYTAKLYASYDPSKTNRLNYSLAKNVKFNNGDYKVEIFHNGSKIGEAKEKLRRGIRPYPF